MKKRKAKAFRNSIKVSNERSFINSLITKYSDKFIIVEHQQEGYVTIQLKSGEENNKHIIFTISKQKESFPEYYRYNMKHDNILEDRYQTYSDEYSHDINEDIKNFYTFIRKNQPEYEFDTKIRQKSIPSYRKKNNKVLKLNKEVYQKMKALEKKKNLKNPLNITEAPHIQSVALNASLKESEKKLKIKSPFNKDLIAGRNVLKSINGDENESALIHGCYNIVKLAEQYCSSDLSDFKIYKIKDYIAKPKPNGYTSIHMIFQHKFKPDCFYELQIRTHRMEIASKEDPEQSHGNTYKPRFINEKSSNMPPKYTFIKDSPNNCGPYIVAEADEHSHQKNFFDYYGVDIDTYRKELKEVQPIIDKLHNYYSHRLSPKKTETVDKSPVIKFSKKTRSSDSPEGRLE